jgi:hypothetical protein
VRAGCRQAAEARERNKPLQVRIEYLEDKLHALQRAPPPLHKSIFVRTVDKDTLDPANPSHAEAIALAEMEWRSKEAHMREISPAAYASVLPERLETHPIPEDRVPPLMLDSPSAVVPRGSPALAASPLPTTADIETQTDMPCAAASAAPPAAPTPTPAAPMPTPAPAPAPAPGPSACADGRVPPLARASTDRLPMADTPTMIEPWSGDAEPLARAQSRPPMQADGHARKPAAVAPAARQSAAAAPPAARQSAEDGAAVPIELSDRLVGELRGVIELVGAFGSRATRGSLRSGSGSEHHVAVALESLVRIVNAVQVARHS